MSTQRVCDICLKPYGRPTPDLPPGWAEIKLIRAISTSEKKTAVGLMDATPSIECCPKCEGRVMERLKDALMDLMTEPERLNAVEDDTPPNSAAAVVVTPLRPNGRKSG